MYDDSVESQKKKLVDTQGGQTVVMEHGPASGQQPMQTEKMRQARKTTMPTGNVRVKRAKVTLVIDMKRVSNHETSMGL